MDGVAREAPAYRAELFQEAAARINVKPTPAGRVTGTPTLASPCPT